MNPIKEDLRLLVDFLRAPEKYQEAGAVMPKGVLMYGPPGTGKTLVARALAGEADVPFFSVAGSDFIELYAGNGARKVRALFDKAEKCAPAIIFIDEIDAIGSSRDNPHGSSEDRQSIDALLACMDGFARSSGLLVIGATNRLNDLDAALTRPGRFDKHICVPLPESPDERREVFDIYSKHRRFSEDVDFDVLSKETVGFSPADIEAVLNEAVLISVQENKAFVDSKCIDDAIFKKCLNGHLKKDMSRADDEVSLVAWHEAGHAVIGKVLGLDVAKVSIIPSTSGSGGVNIIIPKKSGLLSRADIENNIKMAYGGRCAELLLYGDDKNKITTGAAADIEQATQNIYHLIKEYGMADTYGMLNLKVLGVGDNEILDEAIKLSTKLFDEAYSLLKSHAAFHQAVVKLLIEKNTISGADLDVLYNLYTQA